MNVINIHKRAFSCTVEEAGALIDTLSSEKDTLWPRRTWPPMIFDRPLGEGAAGGHGPIRYYVEEYTPGRSVRFRFTGPKGFDGYHGFEVESLDNETVLLSNKLWMKARGRALLTWPVLYEPLHNALMEDSLAKAQAVLGLPPEVKPWSPWVRFLRWTLSGGKARSREMPAERF